MYMVGKPRTLPIDILSDQRKTTSTNSEVQITDKQILEKSTVDRASLTLENSAKKKMKRKQTPNCVWHSDHWVWHLIPLIQRSSHKKEARWKIMEPLWHGPHRVHEDLENGCIKLCLVGDYSKILAQKYNVKQVRCIHTFSQIHIIANQIHSS